MNNYFLLGKLVKKQGRKATGLKLYAMAAGLLGLIPDTRFFPFCVCGNHSVWARIVKKIS